MPLLHYTPYLHDKSKIWVTFIHGAGGSSSIWYKQVKVFRQFFNVLLVDLRGHGRSQDFPQNTRERYTFEVLVEDVREILDHLQIKSSHFVGISLGTIIVREMAERHPHRILSMVMAGAVMKLNLRGKVLMKVGVWLKSLVPYMMLYKFFAWIIMPRKTHQESRNLFIREARKLAQREFVRWFSLAANLNERLQWLRQKDTGIPTLYVMGEQDYMFLPSVKTLVKSHSASSQLVIVPECGHVVNVEQPHYFNEAAIRFLRGI